MRTEASLRHDISRIAIEALRGQRPESPSRLDALLARERPGCEALRSARTDIASSAAHLPVTPQMAWALPQLFKRIQLVAPGILSTSAVLRALIRTPQWDESFARAFTDSGFLSCDRAIEGVRWKYDLGEMMAMQHVGAAWEVLDHCRILLSQHRTQQLVDWHAVLGELRTLVSWFPELQTLQLLERLYARLYVLHLTSVLVVQCWLDWRLGLADARPDPGASAAPALTAFGLQGVHHAA